MKQLLYCSVALLFSTILLQAQGFIGDWKGALTIQDNALPIIFHISEADGRLSATMDSPNQGAFGISTDTCFVQGEQLTIKASVMMLTFTATLREDQLDGTFQQGMARLPLKMKRLTQADSVSSRPQDPQPPFPYQVAEVTFSNPDAEIMLAGTLTQPNNTEAPRVVIMISGSGPQDRNSEILNHRPFLVWADYLTRQGIAVLRFDERGVGESEGDFSRATSLDFASDVQAAIDFIAAHDDFQGSSIGLLGHSEGGLVAPLAALERPESVDFLVLLAAPGVPITELMYEQNVKVAEGQGMVDPTKTMFLDQQKAVFSLVKSSSELSDEAMRDTIFSFYEQRNGGINLRENPQVKKAAEQFSSPWMRFFLAYDPQSILEQLSVPILAINGDKDTQVIAGQNIPGIVAALKKGGNTQLTTQVFPGLNHLFQSADTGQASEYAQIEETVNPMVLEYVTNWILSLK